MAFDVFISYSSKDRETVAAIAAYLERDLVVWWDRELIAGTNFKKDIFDKLSNTGAVLVVWSANAATSPWVEWESLEALRQGRVVIPIMLDATPLPNHLAGIDGIVLRDWDRRSQDRELVQLARDIRLHKRAAAKPSGDAVAGAVDSQAQSRDTPALTVIGFLAALLLLLSRDTSTETLLWAAALIASPLAIAALAQYAKSRIPLQAFNFSQGLISGAVVVGLLSGTGLLIRTVVSSQTPKVMAPSAPPAKPTVDPLREAREAGRAEFATTLDLGAAYHQGSKFCARTRRIFRTSAASSDQAAFEEIVAALVADTIGAEEIRDIYGAGCLNGDWQSLRQSAHAGDMGLDVPFATEAGQQSNALRQLLEKGEFDAARQLLMRLASHDAAALNHLGILDALGLGAGADPNRAYLLFQKAASAGHLPAEANLALCQLFGIGTYLDPAAGAHQFEQVLKRGLDIEKSLWLLKVGTNLMSISSFSELVQTLSLERNRSPIADVVLGVLAARGLTRPPCTMPCAEEVRARIESLRKSGENALARFLEASSRASEGTRAAASSAQGLPGAFGRVEEQWKRPVETPRPPRPPAPPPRPKPHR